MWCLSFHLLFQFLRTPHPSKRCIIHLKIRYGSSISTQFLTKSHTNFTISMITGLPDINKKCGGIHYVYAGMYHSYPHPLYRQSPFPQLRFKEKKEQYPNRSLEKKKKLQSLFVGIPFGRLIALHSQEKKKKKFLYVKRAEMLGWIIVVVARWRGKMQNHAHESENAFYE